MHALYDSNLGSGDQQIAFNSLGNIRRVFDGMGCPFLFIIGLVQ